jgi:DNA-binding LytR/AlgR family response regulator
LQKSIDKYKKLFSSSFQKLQIERMLKEVTFIQKEYKSRILVKTTKGMITLQVEDIACFYIDTQMVFAKLFDNSHYPIDRTLDELEKSLDPKKYFRLNRQVIASVNAIQNIHNYFNNTLKVELKPNIDKEIIVSRYNIKEFKKWLDA